VALAALPLSAIGLLGSAQRAGLAAALAGALTIVVLHVLSRAARGPRLGIAVTTAVLLLVGATVVYPLVVDNPEKQKRYENLLSPSQDGPYQERLTKWRAALDAIEEERFGHGLGAGNPITVDHRFADIASYEIDNSYLMIAYDQGLLVMALFVAAMFVLLVELLRYAVWTRGPGASTLAAAGAGTLVAMLAEFFANDFVYAPPIVAGWMIVGLGVAQFAQRHTASAAAA
jgi:cell division protein FtsW (lipid II flippase)